MDRKARREHEKERRESDENNSAYGAVAQLIASLRRGRVRLRYEYFWPVSCDLPTPFKL